MTRNNRKKIKTKEDITTLHGKNISKAVHIDHAGYDENGFPVFSFQHTDNNRYHLNEWQPDELILLIDTFKRMESMRWPEVLKYRGFRCKHVDRSELPCEVPEMVSPDVRLTEIRVSKKARIFGYRVRNIFRIVWFDRNHEIFDMS